MKLEIQSDYYISLYTEYELPEGKTPDDIKFLDKKWKSIGIHFNDGTCLEVIDEKLFDHQLNDELKRPNQLHIVNDDGQLGKSWDGEGWEPMTLKEMKSMLTL